jgi:signal transduction histidine kinase
MFILQNFRLSIRRTGINRKKIAAFLMVFTFSQLAVQVIAQHEVRNFSVAEGLPSSEAYYAFQDNQGFIWIATDHGVAKFDGFEMTVFGAADGLKDPVVFGISQDHRGRIWFRTYSGQLFFYENGRIHAYRYNDILVKACSRRLMSSMYVDSKDQLWFFLTGDYISGGKIDNKGIFSPDTVANGPVVLFKTIETGHLLGVSGLKVNDDLRFSIDDKNFVVGQYPKTIQSTIQCYVFWRGYLYLSLDKMIFRYDGDQLRKVFTTQSPIISMSIDAADELWIGYHNGAGAERYKNPSFENSWKPDFLAGKSVTRIHVDREKGLWITTLENGVFFLPNSSIELHKYKGLSKVIHVSFSDNEVIFGTYDRTITVTGAQTLMPIAEEKIVTDRWALDSRGNIWINAERPFDHPHFVKRTKYIGHKMIDYAEDIEGNLWILSAQDFAKYDQNGNLLTNTIHLSRARCMFFEDSVIYLAERLGLQVFDTAMHLLETPTSLSSFRISRILKLNDSLLFIATVGNGFLLVKRSDWSYDKFGGESGFMANNVYAAHIRDSSLWMGTEKGVFVVSIKSLLEKDPEYIHFGKSSGLVGNKINFLALTKKSAWAFSDEGISIIPYDHVQKQKNGGQLYLKHLFINKKRMDFSGHITMPHDSTNISITYGFLSLNNQDVVCRYRLTSTDPWVYTKDRSLQFSSLAPNQYQLELEYSDDNFHWKSMATPFQFVVLRPWWQLWYFQMAAMLVTAGLIFLYLRNHFRMLHRHKLKLVQTEIETLERERSRIAKELHDGVATNLGAIKLMANYELRKHSVTIARDVDDYFLTTINEIKGVIYGLTPPELKRDGLFICLENYTEKLNKSLQCKIHLITKGEKISQPEFDLTCFRIIQELLSNSSKHSFSENIFIQVDAEPGFLRIVFRDEGVGFKSNPPRVNGLGLSHIESRVRSAGGQLLMETGPNGTCYTIVIPT